MKDKPLPAGHHVLRYAKQKYCRTVLNATGEQKVIGFTPDAFILRKKANGERESGVSLTWVEPFGEFGRNSIHLAVQATRRSYVIAAQVPFKGAFGIAEVGNILHAGTEHGQQMRIIHAPSKLNEGHAEIRRYPWDNQDLFEMLAEEVFSDLVANDEVAAAVEAVA